MAVLIMRFQAPMQSWGTQSRFTDRDTGIEPSKSGVIGLLCASMGIDRNENIDHLAALKMAVRADREGIVKYDFHTAMNVIKASGSPNNNAVISKRYFLADAVFLVGIESDDIALLEKINHSLKNPIWPQYLGRKSFVPSKPVSLTDSIFIDKNLEEILREYPCLVDYKISENEETKKNINLRIVIDTDGSSDGDMKNDVPVNFAERKFKTRYVKTYFVPALLKEQTCI